MRLFLCLAVSRQSPVVSLSQGQFVAELAAAAAVERQFSF